MKLRNKSGVCNIKKEKANRLLVMAVCLVLTVGIVSPSSGWAREDQSFWGKVTHLFPWNKTQREKDRQESERQRKRRIAEAEARRKRDVLERDARRAADRSIRAGKEMARDVGQALQKGRN